MAEPFDYAQGRLRDTRPENPAQANPAWTGHPHLFVCDMLGGPPARVRVAPDKAGSGSVWGAYPGLTPWATIVPPCGLGV